ncbi:hypothetical protein MTO96_014179 [Rhipicephalus appendiculatus]
MHSLVACAAAFAARLRTHPWERPPCLCCSFEPRSREHCVYSAHMATAAADKGPSTVGGRGSNMRRRAEIVAISGGRQLLFLDLTAKRCETFTQSTRAATGTGAHVPDARKTKDKAGSPRL